jgi:opacity protein-like surface antigen
MKRVLGLLALLLLLSVSVKAQDASPPAPAQDKSAPEASSQDKDKPEKKKPAKDWGPATPQWDITGAYSLLSYYPPTSARIKMNGFDASVDYNLFRRWLAVAADVTGNFKNTGNTINGSTSVYTFMVGPRIYPFGHAHKLIVYGQGLFGGGYVRVAHPATSGFGAFTESETAAAYGAGGGIDYRLSRHWEVRVIEGDFELTHFSVPTGPVTSSASASQSNYRISVGMTYRLGEKK